MGRKCITRKLSGPRFASVGVSYLLFCILLGFTSAARSQASDYPARSVRLVVPFVSGGGNDFVARVLADDLSKSLGQPFVVENRPGGGGITGTEAVVRSKPDGYTLLLSATGSYTSGAYRELPYDPLKDLTAIAHTTRIPLLLLVHPDSPARTVQEFIQLAKERSGKLNFGTPGAGTVHHLALELLKQQSGINVAHIPYKGSGQALTDFMAGRVDVMFMPESPAGPHVRSGKLRVIGITILERSGDWPNVPTLHESGLTGFEAMAWQVIAAPAGTSAPIMRKLNDHINQALTKPEVIKKLKGAGFDTVQSTPEQAAAWVRKDSVKWIALIKSAGIEAPSE